MAEKKNWKEKVGYKPDDSIKKSPNMYIIFLALVFIPLFIGILVYMQTGGQPEDYQEETPPTIGVTDIIEIPSDYDSIMSDSQSTDEGVNISRYYTFDDGMEIELQVTEDEEPFDEILAAYETDAIDFGNNRFYLMKEDTGDANTKSFLIGKDGGNGAVQCNVYAPESGFTHENEHNAEMFLASLKLK